MASGIMGIMPWDYPWAIGNNQNEIVLRTISPILQSASNPEKCWACSAHGEVSGSWGHWTSLQDEARVRDFQPKAVIFSLDFYEMPIWFLWDANLDVLVGPWHTENHSEQQPNFSEWAWSTCHLNWRTDPHCPLWGLFLALLSGGTLSALKIGWGRYGSSTSQKSCAAGTLVRWSQLSSIFNCEMAKLCKRFCPFHSLAQ